jgi:hypothetical protein
MAEFDDFDFSRGEPPAEFETPLRVLEVKHLLNNCPRR